MTYSRPNPAAQSPWDNVAPILPYAGTSGHSGSDASRDRALERDESGKTSRTQAQVLTYVANTGRRGATIADIRAAFPAQHHGTLSGALTALHKGERVDRLMHDRRDKCSVYVLPQFVQGRETVAPKRIGQRDEEVNAAVNRVHEYLSGRSENNNLNTRDVIASSWRREGDQYNHLLASDLRLIVKAMR